MFWTLVTAFVAAFAGAGVGFLLRHMSGSRIPKGIIPICAGLGMIAATVGLEYGWYDGVLGTLPDDTVVISERQNQAWYQPWTYVSPWVRGFVAYSPSDTVETAEGSGIVVVQLLIHERWQAPIQMPVIIDCDGGQRANITPDTDFGDDGRPTNADWIEAGRSDPIIAAICGPTATA